TIGERVSGLTVYYAVFRVDDELGWIIRTKGRQFCINHTPPPVVCIGEFLDGTAGHDILTIISGLWIVCLDITNNVKRRIAHIRIKITIPYLIAHIVGAG